MISLSVELTFEAEIEALHAFLWYETIKKGLGEDFKTSVDLKIKLIQQNPHAYSFIYGDIRSAKIKTFPYNLLYRVSNAKIQIIAIFHHSRNPKGWRKRI